MLFLVWVTLPSAYAGMWALSSLILGRKGNLFSRARYMSVKAKKHPWATKKNREIHDIPENLNKAPFCLNLVQSLWKHNQDVIILNLMGYSLILFVTFFTPFICFSKQLWGSLWREALFGTTPCRRGSSCIKEFTRVGGVTPSDLPRSTHNLSGSVNPFTVGKLFKAYRPKLPIFPSCYIRSWHLGRGSADFTFDALTGQRIGRMRGQMHLWFWSEVERVEKSQK